MPIARKLMALLVAGLFIGAAVAAQAPNPLQTPSPDETLFTPAEGGRTCTSHASKTASTSEPGASDLSKPPDPSIMIACPPNPFCPYDPVSCDPECGPIVPDSCWENNTGFTACCYDGGSISCGAGKHVYEFHCSCENCPDGHNIFLCK